MQLWFSLTVSRACLACSKSFTQGASLNLPRLITAVSQMQLQLHSQTVWFGVFLTRGKPRHDLSTDSRPICSETCCHTQASTVRAAPKRWKYVLLQEQSQCRDTGNGFTGCWTKVSSPTSPCARTCQCSSTIKSIGFQHSESSEVQGQSESQTVPWSRTCLITPAMPLQWKGAHLLKAKAICSANRN